MRDFNQTLHRNFCFFLTLCLLLQPVSPVFALRVQEPRHSSVAPLLKSGLEESAPFRRSDRSVHVLVRAEPKQTPAGYPLETARHLHQVMAPFFQEELRRHGLKETPLVHLPGVSQALGKPVYLLREALLPTGSSKPRMLAALFDLYLNGDPHDLTGRRGKQRPRRWGTQSTGNHLLAMAWGGRQLGLQVLGFTMNGIPAAKKSRAEELGAKVLDRYRDYQEARRAMEAAAAAEGEEFIHWRHGDRPVIFGNMATAVQLQSQIERDRPAGLSGRFAVISAAGAGGRIAGLSAGLTQIFGSRVKVIGAETRQIPPLFMAAAAGRPVPIPLPARRAAVDGIAVDQAEEEALDVVLKAADAVALVEEEADAVPFTKWLAQDLEKAGWAGDLARTEVVTGMSLSVPFRYPWLVEGLDAVIVDETGRNVDPADWERVLRSPLPGFAGAEEKPDPPTRKLAGPIRWAGDQPAVQVTADDRQRAVTFLLDLWAPGVGWDRLKESLELILFIHRPERAVGISVGPASVRHVDGRSGPYRENHRVAVEVSLPEEVWSDLEAAGYLPYQFQYRFKGSRESDAGSSEWENADGRGEIVYQPPWLFEGAVYTVNVKAWGGFEAVRKRLDDLRGTLGVQMLLLQGIHPGGTAFEIDDYEQADPAMGGEAALDRLLQEGHEKGFRFLIPWVPGHSSPRNRLLGQHPQWYRPAPPSAPADSTVAVTLPGGERRLFWRGNVFPKGTLPGEIHGGFGPGTVQFDLWDPEKRAALADYWEGVLGRWAGRGIDGFYADTGHSIHRVAPGWLEAVERRVRKKHPHVVVGYEAHWQEHGGFIFRGGSFAQQHELYHDFFRRMVHGQTTARALTRRLKEIPLWLQRQSLLFLENHDEPRIAQEIGSSRWIAHPLRLAANQALSAILILGAPGIPLLNSGQEAGYWERWLVTGQPESYHRQQEQFPGQEIPLPPRMDPFAGRNSEADQLRGFLAGLLALRSGAGRLFGAAGDAQFPETDSDHCFVAYRSSGARRGLLIAYFDPAARDPRAAVPVRVRLDSLRLGPGELRTLKRALEKPALADPPLERSAWALGPDGTEDARTLDLKVRPFQVVALEFEVDPAAAAEKERSPLPAAESAHSPDYGRMVFTEDPSLGRRWDWYEPSAHYPVLLDEIASDPRSGIRKVSAVDDPAAFSGRPRYVSEDGLVSILPQGDGIVLLSREPSPAGPPGLGPYLRVEEGIRFLGPRRHQRFIVAEAGSGGVGAGNGDVKFRWEDDEFSDLLIRRFRYDAESRLLTVDLDPRVGTLGEEPFLLTLDLARPVTIRFQRAAVAGLEEPDFQPPAAMDRPVPALFWEDGGRVYPSSRDPLGTVAFVSPENGRGGVGLYASIYRLDGLKDSEAIRGLFLLPDVPRHGTRPLYDEKPAGPAQEALRELREKAAAVLKAEGFEVVALVSGKPKRIPMIPLDIGGGEIRFGGWVPAQEEWIGDHTFTVEISWKGESYRLEEDGWFRIHRAGNGAVRAGGIPVPKKARMWNSPWGPQVIGWNFPPPAAGESPPESAIVRPEAGQDLWFKFWGGRYYLLSREEMGRYGFPFDAGRPDIPQGRPIVEVRVRPGGILEIPSLESFEDPTLAARLEKSAELVAQKRAEPSSARGTALAPTLEIIGQLERVQSPEESRDLFLELDQAGWPRLGQQLRQGPAEERNRLVRLLSQSFHQWARSDPEAPVVKRDNLGEAESYPSIRRGPPAIAFSSNGVLDLFVRPGRNGGIRQIEGHWAEGGGPLTVARAMGNIREGGSVAIVAMGAGDSGERLFESLERRGFHEAEPMAGLDLDGNEIVPIRATRAGQRSRVNVNGLLSFGPTISLEELQQAIHAVLAKMERYGPGGTLVIGERLPDLDHPDGARRAAGELAGLASGARRMGWSVAVAASGSWTPEAAGMILEARPSTFHATLEPFARWVNRDPRELLDRPEEVARLADQIRSRNQIERMIVSLGAAGEVFSGRTGWYHAVPSPVLELTYVTGERDVFLGVFTQFLQGGASEKEALHLAAVAGVLHMENWGRPVAGDQIQANLHRARVYPLLESLLQPAKELLVVPLEELEEWPDKAAFMEFQEKRGLRFDGVYLWVQRERQFGPPVLHLGDFPALYSIRGTPEQVARYFGRREEKVRIHLPGTRQGPLLRRLLDQAGIAVREFSAGLEEGIAERFRMLVEGRTERGVLVVPDYMAANSPGLRKFLARMPAELAASVILWGEDPHMDDLGRRNPALRRFRGDLLGLGLYLAELEGADRVGVLSDQEAVAVLAPRMKRLGISVRLVRWNISEILEILGDPQELSSQVDLDRLVGELFTERGT